MNPALILAALTGAADMATKGKHLLDALRGLAETPGPDGSPLIPAAEVEAAIAKGVAAADSSLATSAGVLDRLAAKEQAGG